MDDRFSLQSRSREPPALRKRLNARTLSRCRKRLLRVIQDTNCMIQIGNGKRRIATYLLAALLTMTGAAKAEDSPVEGTWIIRDLVLHIFDCQPTVCGRIVWLKDATRRSSQCGKTIIWGLEAKGPTDWTGGSILDPITERPTNCRRHTSRTARFTRGSLEVSHSSERQKY